MDRIDLPVIGALQKIENIYPSEDPLAEVWARIAQLGTSAFLQRHFKANNPDIPWERYLGFVEVRVRQSLEFRTAARGATLLTSPLTLYYSFLNLLRAFLALGPEIMPQKSHGLRFESSAHLLDSCAKLQRGTFTDYLTSQNIPWAQGEEISLRDALGFIPEIEYEARNITDGVSYVDLVHINGTSFPMSRVDVGFSRFNANDFELQWQKAFPALSDICSYRSPRALVLKQPPTPLELQQLKDFARANFLPPLIIGNSPAWYIFRSDNSKLKLDRLGYYFVAMFILGNAVRYEPELMLSANAPDSETGWFLRRFISISERFFPQLIFMKIYNDEVYFSGQALI